MIERLWVVRPNLGNPIILEPEELKHFTLTVAYRKPWDAKESTVEWPQARHLRSLENQLKRGAGALRLVWHNLGIPLQVHNLHGYARLSPFKEDYSGVRHAVTSAQQQYVNGFRWEIKVDVGIPAPQVERLRRSAGWPTLLHIENRFDPTFGKRNWQAVYVHETMKRSQDLTILHVSDLHIAKRNDLIPELLCRVRNRKECEELKTRYVNFNDHLRAFIKEANARARDGQKVLVVATGDLTDYYFDGYWDGKFVCGQGRHAKDRRKEAAGSAWASNIKVFQDIITGQDGKGEGLQCPLFTVLGNHDYYANEILLNWKCHLSRLGVKLYQKDSYRAFGLRPPEGTEYDFWAFPRIGGRYHFPPPEPDSIAVRKTFKEFRTRKWQASLNQDWSYWLIKPKSWILSQYLCTINYDLDFELNVGDRHLLLLNTGHDRYPSQETLALSKISKSRLRDWEIDFVNDGPHARGISAEHLNMLRRALNSEAPSFIMVFTHAPLVQLEKRQRKGPRFCSKIRSRIPYKKAGLWAFSRICTARMRIVSERQDSILA